MRSLAALLFLSALLPLPAAGAPDNGKGGPLPPAPSYEDRRAAEQAARSRFRRLELASLVLIVAGAGAAAWWTLRKK